MTGGLTLPAPIPPRVKHIMRDLNNILFLGDVSSSAVFAFCLGLRVFFNRSLVIYCNNYYTLHNII